MSTRRDSSRWTTILVHLTTLEDRTRRTLARRAVLRQPTLACLAQAFHSTFYNADVQPMPLLFEARGVGVRQPEEGAPAAVGGSSSVSYNLGSDDELLAAWEAEVLHDGRDACLAICVTTATHRKRTFGGVPHTGLWYTPMQSSSLLEFWLISHGVDVSSWGSTRARRSSSGAETAPAGHVEAQPSAQQGGFGGGLLAAVPSVRVKSVADLFDELRTGKMMLWVKIDYSRYCRRPSLISCRQQFASVLNLAL